MPSSREFRPETRTMAYICVGRVDVTCKRFACEDSEQSHVLHIHTTGGVFISDIPMRAEAHSERIEL